MASFRAHLAAVFLMSGCATSRAALTPQELTKVSLISTNETPSTLGELLKGNRATVLIFWSAGCPCVARYQGRIDSLARTYAPLGISVQQVSSNAGETLESLKEAVALRKLQLPIWRDEGGILADSVGARSTPTVVVLSPQAEILYRGFIDNERAPGEPGREPWLEEALAGITQGTPYKKNAPTWGCSITRSLSAPSPGCHSPKPSEEKAAMTGVTP